MKSDHMFMYKYVTDYVLLKRKYTDRDVVV